MITRRQFLAHLMASGAYAKAAAATPRFLFGEGADGAGLDDAVITGEVQAFTANQNWRVLSVPSGATMDVSTSADLFLQFGDALVDRVASASTAIYYPASGVGTEPVGIPAAATRVAVRAVQADATVTVASLGTPVAYGGPSVALRFDVSTSYTLALPPDLVPPFTIVCRFRSQVLNQTDHILTNGLWGATAPQRAIRTAAANGRLELLEHATDGSQAALAFDGWFHGTEGSPLWSVVGGSWRPNGFPGKGGYAHNAENEYFSLADTTDPAGAKADALPDLVVGADPTGALTFQGLVEWIWIVRHEMSQGEWDTLKRINIDTSIWPPDLASDTAVFIPIQARAPLVDVISGRELALRAGAGGTQANIGSSRLALPGRVGPTVTIPYGATGSAPVPLPLPNKGIWRAQAHHDVRIEMSGSPANASSRLVPTGTGVVLAYGSTPQISVIANNPADAGALNLTALV
jgi:hypothetical protein